VRNRPPTRSWKLRSPLDVVRPRGGFVAGGEAAVEDADETVGDVPESSVVWHAAPALGWS
jgi:hypothetical protein